MSPVLTRSAAAPASRVAAAVAAVAGAMLTALLLGVPSPSSAAIPAYCTLGWEGQKKFVWDGGGKDGQWSTPANWSNDLEPNKTYGSTGYVCIPSGAQVIMGDGVQGDVQALDVQGGATLTLATGSKLFVHGDQAARPSVVRAAAQVYNSGALGGPGRLDLLGTMWWRSTDSGASTIATRECSLGAGCPGPVDGTPGHLEVGDTGVVEIDERGVNLQDQYRIVVRGKVSMSDRGYIAADRGTRFELAAKTTTSGVGRLTIANDGGYYEGRTLNGLTTLSTLVNGGLIEKTSGSGTSVVSATYSRISPGKILVRSGSLAFPDGTTHAARVSAGRSWGSGRCGDSGTYVPGSDAYGCVPATGSATAGHDPQAQMFQVPTADTDGAGVTVTEITGGLAGRIGREVRLHATGLTASPSAPAVVQIRYDSSLLNGKTWERIKVYRRADGTTAYVEVPSCDSEGRPPAGSVGCVDRRGLPSSSRNVNDPGDAVGDPVDVVIVVRTTATSRWVGR